jgi:hypothetical protein
MKPIRFAGWSGCYRLTNASLEVVVVPAIGRIMHLAPPGHPSLLNQNPAVLGKKLKRDVRWANGGGDWLWPVAQSHWQTFSPEGKDWPPPPAVGEAAWEAQAWINSDGSQSCLLMRRFAAPVNLLVTRRITLDPNQPRLRVLQSALRVGPSDIPITLWNISQMRAPSRVLLPADPTAPDGLRNLFPQPPATGDVTRVGDVLVCRGQPAGEFKIGTGPAVPWVAAHVGDSLVVEYSAHRLEGPLPDGGCAVEVYANGGLGYAEIELLSPEQSLDVGERAESTLIIECHPLPASASDAEAIKAAASHRP